jgi:hypothetical protein
MRTMVKYSVLLMLLFGLAAAACAVDLSRETVAEPGKLPGTYTAVLIGGTFAADAERVAIFDLEGDGYSFLPVTPPYRVKKVEGLTASAALAEAEKLFSSHCAYNGYRVKSLKLPDGAIVGYELTPDYPPALCEWGNTVTVSYDVGSKGVIKVYTGLLLPVDDGPTFGKNEGIGNKLRR